MDACAKCSKPQTAEHSLKICAKCKSIKYCDRKCQQADWKRHKKDCSRLAGEREPSTTNNESAVGVPSTARAGASVPGPFSQGKGDGPHIRPFHAIQRNKYLHDRPEQETFKLLIDCLCMRQEDEYVHEGNTLDGSIYNGMNKTSVGAFRDFISMAKKVKGFLPPWLTDAKVDKCIKWAQKTNHGFSLAHAQEKHDIQETWADDKMPMKLRMMADKVYGYTPGGSDGNAMMGLMLAMEGDDLEGVMSELQLGEGGDNDSNWGEESDEDED